MHRLTPCCIRMYYNDKNVFGISAHVIYARARFMRSKQRGRNKSEERVEKLQTS